MSNYFILNFKKVGSNEIGYLVPVEALKDVPFEIKRVYYIFDVPRNFERGFHAHKKLHQVLICLNGSVKVMVEFGSKSEIFNLNDPSVGLYVGPLVWREMYDFSKGSVLLVLASDYYKEEDYIRDYETYKKEFELFARGDK